MGEVAIFLAWRVLALFMLLILFGYLSSNVGRVILTEQSQSGFGPWIRAQIDRLLKRFRP